MQKHTCSLSRTNNSSRPRPSPAPDSVSLCQPCTMRLNRSFSQRRRIMSAMSPWACCFASESDTHRYHLR